MPSTRGRSESGSPGTFAAARRARKSCAGFREVATALAFAAAAEPPPELRLRVMAAVGRTRQLPPQALPRWQFAWLAAPDSAQRLAAAARDGHRCHRHRRRGRAQHRAVRHHAAAQLRASAGPGDRRRARGAGRHDGDRAGRQRRRDDRRAVRGQGANWSSARADWPPCPRARCTSCGSSDHRNGAGDGRPASGAAASRRGRAHRAGPGIRTGGRRQARHDGRACRRDEPADHHAHPAAEPACGT